MYKVIFESTEAATMAAGSQTSVEWAENGWSDLQIGSLERQYEALLGTDGGTNWTQTIQSFIFLSTLLAR